MSYPNFPNIQSPSYDPNNRENWPGWSDVVVETKAGGYTISRPLNTLLSMGNTFVWPAMPDADYQTLRAFVLQTIRYAGAFYFTLPGTNTTKLMQLTAEPQALQQQVGLWSVQLSMREVGGDGD